MKTPFLSKILFGAALLSLSLVTSCKDDKNANPEVEATTTNNTSNTTSDDKVAQVNPAHGLPGHRCDIPVGAPLNSAAASQTATPATNTTSSNVSPIRVDKKPSVNPPMENRGMIAPYLWEHHWNK